MSDAFYPGQTDYLHKLSEMWVMFEEAIENATGPQGWSPSLAVVPDGSRRVIELVDWVGGEGTKPTMTGFLSETGIVTDIEDAVDIRGTPGTSEWSEISNKPAVIAAGATAAEARTVIGAASADEVGDIAAALDAILGV